MSHMSFTLILDNKKSKNFKERPKCDIKKICSIFFIYEVYYMCYPCSTWKSSPFTGKDLL